jgi:hypothetical protein
MQWILSPYTKFNGRKKFILKYASKFIELSFGAVSYIVLAGNTPYHGKIKK